MKKTLILAMVGLLLISGSAFAAGRQLVAQPNATFAPGGGSAFGPTTTNNDDSCDIGTAPAATLLLPYFEVDLGTAGTGRTTLFTVTNVSPYAQIAHITLYTDWSFPVLDFNIFLTGYDVQALNLFDIIARGLIGGVTGSSTSAPNATSSTGSTNNRFAPNTSTVNGANPSVGTQPFRVISTDMFGNPNFDGSVGTNCAPGRLPGQLPGPLAIDVRNALTIGSVSGAGIACSQAIGSNHGANTAVGYATIDVAATCSQRLPTEYLYFTTEILYDNVLIGEYFDVNQGTAAGNYAGGNPMVHIRAVPEGGGAGSSLLLVPPTNLPYTFYDRYTFNTLGNDRRIDRRQPLPSAFAARWISGSTAAFDTQFKIWREGITGNEDANNICVDASDNQDIPVTEFVRFDENENASVLGLGGIIVSPPPPGAPGLPETSRQPISPSAFFPVLAPVSTDVGGWMYMNLNNGGDPLYSGTFAGVTGGRTVSQNWVIVSMFAEGRYGVDFDAAWLGNGCSPAFPEASSAGVADSPAGRIAPAGGVLVCPPGTQTTQTTATAANCIGTNTTP